MRPVLVLSLVLLCACQGEDPSSSGPPGSVFPRSEFWQPIAKGAPVDPESAGYIADLRRAAQGGRININLSAYNVAVYPVDASTPLVPLRVRAPTALSPSQLPVPPGARPASGGDGHLVLLDRAAGKSYELWQATPPSGQTGWTATVAAALDTQGDGVSPFGVRATGLSLLLGLITYDEIQAGAPIAHALAWAFDKPSSLYFTPPAVASDGKANGGRASAIPAGARLQLDPTLDLDTLGLSPAGRRLAEAMQRYGLICVDTSGDSSVVAEALSGERRWEGLLGEDALHGIPIERLRVLRPSTKIPIP